MKRVLSRWPQFLQQSNITDSNTSDFLFPNGNFNGKKFDLSSLITDRILAGDASPYLATASDRPASETNGPTELEAVGNALSNIPAVPPGYVGRPVLESVINETLLNDRHPIVTLVGRGGIGKTSLALSTLHDIAGTNRYDAILWFSAQDIDLTVVGPKVVKPQVLSRKDIADQFSSLMGGIGNTGSDPVQMMADNLRKSQTGGPLLFVFDNFETVVDPVDVFSWIDTNLRLPNKVLITSRFRDFKADFPIEVFGMDEKEALELVDITVAKLGISKIVDTKYKLEVVQQSDGHPYVIKIMLGEVADRGRVGSPERIVARKDDILDALFERTFANLSPLAERLFLTLGGWRSLMPQLAVEAVVMRGQGESLDPRGAIEELVRMSLVERSTAPDGAEFLELPLTAALFAAKKLNASPLKLAIELIASAQLSGCRLRRCIFRPASALSHRRPW